MNDQGSDSVEQRVQRSTAVKRPTTDEPPSVSYSELPAGSPDSPIVTE
jgi:hypothetical protein